MDTDKKKQLDTWLADFKKFKDKANKVAMEYQTAFSNQLDVSIAKAITTPSAQKFAKFNSIIDTYAFIIKRYINFHKAFISSFNVRVKGAQLKTYDPLNFNIEGFKNSHIEPFIANIQSIFGAKFTSKINDFVEDSADQDILRNRIETLETKFQRDIQKLCDLYNNTPNIMDLIFNRDFIVVYVIKLLRIVFAYGALYITSKIFQENYVTEVFANNKDPPSLNKFILIFWGFETLMIVLLMIILMLVKYVFNDELDSFPINNNVLRKFLLDYVVCTVLVLSIGFILAGSIMKKKYFKYKTDGLRAVRGLQEMYFYIIMLIYVIPFNLAIP